MKVFLLKLFLFFQKTRIYRYYGEMEVLGTPTEIVVNAAPEPITYRLYEKDQEEGICFLGRIRLRKFKTYVVMADFGENLKEETKKFNSMKFQIDSNLSDFFDADMIFDTLMRRYNRMMSLVIKHERGLASTDS